MKSPNERSVRSVLLPLNVVRLDQVIVTFISRTARAGRKLANTIVVGGGTVEDLEASATTPANVRAPPARCAESRCLRTAVKRLCNHHPTCLVEKHTWSHFDMALKGDYPAEPLSSGLAPRPGLITTAFSPLPKCSNFRGTHVPRLHNRANPFRPNSSLRQGYNIDSDLQGS